jgi:hypothetical protein
MVSDRMSGKAAKKNVFVMKGSLGLPDQTGEKIFRATHLPGDWCSQ